MSEHRPLPARSIIESMIIGSMIALLPALLISGILAFLLLRCFHGYRDYPAIGDSFWVYYFTFGDSRIDAGVMLIGFILAFILVPVALGVGFAFSRRLPRCRSAGHFFASFFGLGAAMVIPLALNLYVGFLYLVWNWNSSQPF